MNILDLIFPKLCVGCNKFGTYLCSSCKNEIKQTDLVCPVCEKNSIGGLTHPLCSKKYRLDGLWSLGIYEGSLKRTIQKIKYKFVSDVGESLINLIVEYWAKNSPLFLDEVKKDGGEGWVIVPVPLHPKRERFRGFNQSALLGKILAQKIGLKYGNYLKRIKYTKPQVGLMGFQRKQNIKGAFSLNTSHFPLITNILLVDDVWTTGSTLKECCYILKAGGAKKVWALTIAR